jgi:glycine/D-amino acid oxidase-like deaminating enzyme/nitrite reductase/ring-hydroxylating ferredoxin subunit
MLDPISGSTRPVWLETAVIHKQPHQTGQLSVDVCIIGGGITGLTAADLLKRAGKTVAVVELSRIGLGETGHTTAHLTEVLDVDYRDLLSRFGIDGGQLACQASRKAIDKIEENALLHGIQCEFRRLSGFQYTGKVEEVEDLESEAEAALRLGVPNELVFETPLPFKTERAIRFDHQAQFHPIKYLNGLAATISGDGSYIFEETRMLDIEEGEPCRVTTDRGTIIADQVFVASNVPSSNRLFLHTKIAAYRTYAIAAKVRDDFDRDHLFWDIDEPYHYIRSASVNGAPYLIIGGADHKTGHEVHTDVAYEKLENWARQHFDVESVDHRWSGQVIEPVDGLPFIGLNPMSQHIYVATGFAGNGMTFGTVAAMIVSDMILGNQNPWVELFDAARVKPLASMKSFFAENIDFPSHLISDRFSHAVDARAVHIRENQGAIVKVAGKKVAAYRDPQGALHMMSPVCPHLGCHVGWNEAEKSWDCPCHGSRFSPVGKLINGPAVSDLASEDYDEEIPLTPEYYEQQNPISANPLAPPLVTFFTCPLKH